MRILLRLAAGLCGGIEKYRSASPSIKPLAVGLAIVVLVTTHGLYFWSAARPAPQSPPDNSSTSTLPNQPPSVKPASDGIPSDFTDLFKLSAVSAFDLRDLGLKVAFFTEEQSALMLGMPSGAVVMEVNSSLPAGKAGLEIRDVLLSIGGKQIRSENDLRSLLAKVRPGKTGFSVKRDNKVSTVSVDCPACKVQ